MKSEGELCLSGSEMEYSFFSGNQDVWVSHWQGNKKLFLEPLAPLMCTNSGIWEPHGLRRLPNYVALHVCGRVPFQWVISDLDTKFTRNMEWADLREKVMSDGDRMEFDIDLCVSGRVDRKIRGCMTLSQRCEGEWDLRNINPQGDNSTRYVLVAKQVPVTFIGLLHCVNFHKLLASPKDDNAVFQIVPFDQGTQDLNWNAAHDYHGVDILRAIAIIGLRRIRDHIAGVTLFSWPAKCGCGTDTLNGIIQCLGHFHGSAHRKWILKGPEDGDHERGSQQAVEHLEAGEFSRPDESPPQWVLDASEAILARRNGA